MALAILVIITSLNFGPFGYIISLILSFSLGALSYFMIEKPSNFLTVRKAVLSFIIITGAFTLLNSARLRQFSEVWVSIEQTTERKKIQCYTFKGNICKYQPNENNLSFAVIGDSHATMFHPVFEHITRSNQTNGIYLSRNGMAPIKNIYSLRKDQVEHDHFQLRNEIFSTIKALNIKKVILISRWTYYTTGGYDGIGFSKVSLDNSSNTREESFRDFRLSFEDTIQTLTDNNVEVFVVLQVPQQKSSPKAIYEIAFNKVYPKESKLILERNLRENSVSRSDNRLLQHYINSYFSSFGEMINIVDPSLRYCDESKCPVGSSTVSYYSDDDHLSTVGAFRMYRIFQNVISDYAH